MQTRADRFAARPSRRASGWMAFALAALGASAAFGQAAADPAAPAKAVVRALRADLAALQGARDALRRTVPPPAADGQPLTATLRFGDLFAWHDRWGSPRRGDLEATIYANGARLYALPATCGSWGPARHEVDASGLKIAPAGVEGKLVLHVADRSAPRVTVEVSATAANGDLTGTYKSDGGDVARAGEGTLSGRLTLATAAIPPPGKPDDSATADLSEDLYATAQWVERASIALYQEIRALVLARDGALSFPHAWALTRRESLLYPELPKVTKAGKVTKKKDAQPSVDDAMTDVMGDLRDEASGAAATQPRSRGAGESPAAASADGAVFRALDRTLAGIAARVRERCRLAEAAAKATPGAPTPPAPVGSQDTGDAAFGPWYGEEALPSAKDKPNLLPANAGEPGPQHWPWIGGWVCLGPFPRAPRGAPTPTLPEFVPAFDLRYPIERGLAPTRGKGGGEGPTSFLAAPAIVEPGTGFARSAMTMAYEDHGPRRIELPLTTMYAFTEIHAEADREAWLGVNVNDHGELWIGDRLVWTSPAIKDPRSNEDTYVFKAAFRAGANRLVFRYDNDMKDAHFCVRVCARGRPRPAEEAARTAAAAAATLEKAGPVLAGVRGWRNDFTGRYPNAKPPVAWDPIKGINVLWRVPMGVGHATPVFAGDKLLVTEEPQWLVCLDKATGKELWRTECDIALTRGEAIRAEAERVRARVATAQAELGKLGPGRGERLDALKAQGLAADAAQARLREMEDRANEYGRFLNHNCGASKPSWGNDTGHMYPTPVTDGTHAWVKSNTGALGCFDLSGKLVWVVDHEGSTGSPASVSSPLLIAGKVVVFVVGKGRNAPPPAAEQKAAADDEEPPPDVPTTETGDLNVLKAYDAATGRLAWKVETELRGQLCGTPAPLRLSDGQSTMDVIVTANGAVVRAEDGKVLRRYIGSREFYGSPVAEGGTVVISGQADKAAYDLTMLDRDTVGVRTRWNREHPGVFQDGNYGLFHEGRLFFSRPLVDVSDAATGDLLWVSGNVFFCRPGRGYAPPLLADGKFYVADNATWFQPTYRPRLSPFPGAMSVLSATVPGLVLARNSIEQLHGGFAADGNRLYVRSMRSLMCFGHTGDEGRRYEAETVAREVLSGLAGRPLADAPATAQAMGSLADGKKFPVSDDAFGEVLAWLVAGPFPAAAESELARRVSDPAWPGWQTGAGAEVKAGDVSALVRRLHGENLKEWAGSDPFGLREREAFGRGPHIGWSEMLGHEVDLFRVMDGKPRPGMVAVLATALRSPLACAGRLDTGHPRARAWVGGAETRHGQTVTLPEGFVSLVLVVKLDDPGDGSLWLRPMLSGTRGHERDMKDWLAHTERCRPYLEQAAALSPASAIGKRARTALNEAADAKR